MADILLVPYSVGLVIIDSFATETPLINTNSSHHGPEIEYLENDINGIMTDNTLESYCNSIISLLKDKNKLSHLKCNCIKSANKFTIEEMVSNFKNGIIKVLKHY